MSRKPEIYLSFRDRPDSFKAPHCDCLTTCWDCWKEGREPIGRLSAEEKAERQARADARMWGAGDEP